MPNPVDVAADGTLDDPAPRTRGIRGDEDASEVDLNRPERGGPAAHEAA